METFAPEVLLLNAPVDCSTAKPPYNRFLGRLAPLGLFCLAATAPDRVMVIDEATSQQILEQVSLISAASVKAVIIHIHQYSDLVKISHICSRLRGIFSSAAIGCNSATADFPSFFDFSTDGTGKTAVLRILRGERLCGFINTADEDFNSPLPVPCEVFADCGYDIMPEKWLSARTIEICQPWLGLLDQAGLYKTYPGIEWFSRFCLWLKQSGFSAFHLRPSGIACENMHELRSLMLNLNVSFAISFDADASINMARVGAPLRQVWLYHPTASHACATLEKMRQIRDAGFQPCLVLDRQWFDIDDQQALLAEAHHLAVSDECDWPFEQVKKLTLKYWGSKNRFFRRLLAVKNAAELVMFMKISYTILDIIFSSEKTGR